MHRTDFPLKTCDFKKWTRYDSLPIEQACFVLLGYEPPSIQVLRQRTVQYQERSRAIWEKPSGFDDMLALLENSIKSGTLTFRQDVEYNYLTKHVRWPELVRWASSKGYEVPLELLNVPSLASQESKPAGPNAADVPPEPLPTEKPWLNIDPRDPEPAMPWYTPARYFARQLVKEDSTLLTKRPVLAKKVARSLESAGFLKRGNKKPLDEGTVLKAFVNVTLG